MGHTLYFRVCLTPGEIVVRRSRVRPVAVAVGLTALVAASLTAAPAQSRNTGLPLGDPALPETRTVTPIAPGVNLTDITRGTGQAKEKDYQSTRTGPWRVRMVTIDPAAGAVGSLRATYGPTLAPTETVSQLAAYSGAQVAVNASFFTFSASRSFPGDPVGIGLYDGQLLSEPSSGTAEVSMLMDARTNQVTFPGKLAWRERMVNKRSGNGLKVEFLGHPPVVPSKCATKKDPTNCGQAGDVVRLPAQFSETTPAGKGVEVVLGRSGCVVSREKERGTTLKPVQTSIQATGKQTQRLWTISRAKKKAGEKKACLRSTMRLRDALGNRVPTGPWMYGVNGRFTLTRDGQAVVPRGDTSLFMRHPRTFVGRTDAGQIGIVTIDGRQPSSVGASLRETAQVALSLGLTNAINLDGGGSTTMVVNGALANSVSGSGERSVGDALIWSPTPYARPKR